MKAENQDPALEFVFLTLRKIFATKFGSFRISKAQQDFLEALTQDNYIDLYFSALTVKQADLNYCITHTFEVLIITFILGMVLQTFKANNIFERDLWKFV